ncbi:MAG: MFS transporter [Sphingobacteriales bacterium]|nr:MAG: MFS transporter [Sphingobacteriales bacterium]
MKNKEGNLKHIKNSFTGKQIVMIILLAMTQFTVILDFMVMSPLGDMLMKSMELKPSQFGLSVSAYAFSAAASGILTAGFADKYDRKKLLLFFYFGFIIGTLFCSLANTYVLLLMARIVTGLFGGVIGSISMAIVADIFRLEQRGRVLSFTQMGMSASQIIGIPISLYLANSVGWQSPFVMIVILSILISLFIIFSFDPMTHHIAVGSGPNPWKHVTGTLFNRQHSIGFITTAIMSIGGFMMMPWNSAYLINNLHVSAAQLPLIFMAGGIGSLLIMPIVGKLSDRKNKFTIFCIASIWLIIIVLIYTNLPKSTFPIVVFLYFSLTVGIVTRMIPSMTLITALPEVNDRGAFMSVNASLQQISGGIAAVIGALMIGQKTKTSIIENFDVVGYFVVVLTMLSLILIRQISNRVNHNSTNTIQAMQ